MIPMGQKPSHEVIEHKGKHQNRPIHSLGNGVTGNFILEENGNMGKVLDVVILDNHMAVVKNKTISQRI